MYLGDLDANQSFEFVNYCISPHIYSLGKFSENECSIIESFSHHKSGQFNDPSYVSSGRERETQTRIPSGGFADQGHHERDVLNTQVRLKLRLVVCMRDNCSYNCSCRRAKSVPCPVRGV